MTDIDTIKSRIAAQWNNKAAQKIDWLAMEQTLRDTLHNLANGNVAAGEALVMLDDTIAAWTRRGNELPDSFIV